MRSASTDHTEKIDICRTTVWRKSHELTDSLEQSRPITKLHNQKKEVTENYFQRI